MIFFGSFKVIRKRVFAVLVAAFLLLAFDQFPGFLRERLEHKLTDLFGMPVTVARVELQPRKGKIVLYGLRFMNQPQYSFRPHLYIESMSIKPDWLTLTRKLIHIKEIKLTNFLYLIERRGERDEARNNVVDWYHHMKDTLKRNRAKHKKSASRLHSRYRWKLLIDRIDFENGVFIFHQCGPKDLERKYLFRELSGYLLGLRWPDKHPEILDQQVLLGGIFGENGPAPFMIEGRASFATYQISFDLKGRVRNGAVTDYPHFWHGLPVVVKDGRYDLNTRVVCLRRRLTSQNQLWLHGLKMKSRLSLSGQIFGVPVKTWMGFMQDERTLQLNVPLRGDIESPELRSGEAVNNAFQMALRVRTQKGLHLATHGAMEIASTTGALVTEGPVKVVDGLGKLVSFMPKMDWPAIAGMNKAVEAVAPLLPKKGAEEEKEVPVAASVDLKPDITTPAGSPAKEGAVAP